MKLHSVASEIPPGHDARRIGEEERRRIEELELDTLMGNGRGFSPVYLFIMTAFAALMQPVVDDMQLALWMASYIFYVAGLTLATLQYHGDPFKAIPERIRFWRGFVGKSALVHAVILGSTGLMAIPAMGQTSSIVLTSLVLVVDAASTAYAAAMFWPLALLLVVSMLPYVVVWWPLSESMDQPIAAILIGATLILLHLAWTLHLTVRQGFRETFAKEQLAAELTISNRQLDAIGAARSHLFAIASHDLRGPVHAIGLAVGQLDKRSNPDVLERQFQQLREHTSLVAEMLGDMMDISRLERQDARVRLEAVDLDQMFEQVRLNFEPIARQKGLQIHFHKDGAWVQSDGHLLRRILFNLVSNAIRYTVRGEVIVRSRHQGGQVEIEVTDTGVGIDASTQETIFEDDVQLPRTGTSTEGLGLGLPFARRAAETLGHELTLQSRLGAGSTFTVRAAAASQPAATRQALSEDEADVQAPVGATLLVVENDPFTLNAICGLLQKWGYAVVEGQGGDELLAKLDEAAAPALVISDLQLSQSESGLDVIASVRERFGPQLPALLLTGNVDRAVEVQTAERQIVLVHKPLAPAQLRRQIESLLG